MLLADILPRFSTANWMLVSLAAVFIGMSKAGLKGVDMLNVTIMAIVFGGKASTGVVLPLLCAGDVLAVLYYYRHARWPIFRKLVPWMMLGIIAGVFTGKGLDETMFRKIMAIIIMSTVIIMVAMELRRHMTVPTNPLFTALMGLVSGFTTMLGNLAGAFSNIYFLALQLNKNDFIGTAAWVFLFMNFFKLPFQFFYWHNMDMASLTTDLILVPAVIVGFWAGVKIVAKIRDDNYRKLVIALTMVGALFIFFRR